MPALAHPTLLVEYATTRDTQIDEPNDGWRSQPTPPAGSGWCIHDASHDHKTRWRRVRLVEASEALRLEREDRR